MKKLIIFLISLLLYAQNIQYINPFEENVTVKENNKSIQEINTEIKTDENITKNESNISLTPIVQTQTEILQDNFKSLIPYIKIAVIYDNNMKNFLFDIMNSLNAYFLYKKVNFSIRIFEKKDFNETVAKNYNFVINYTLDTNITKLNNLQTNIFFPILRKSDVNLTEENQSQNYDFFKTYTETKSSFYFGGIDFKKQINKLLGLMINNNAIAINSNTYFSKKLTEIESKEINITIFTYPKINYQSLENKNIIFNTSSVKTAEILSKINYLDVNTSLQFSTQINYDPNLISLTQPKAVEKIIIANSILNIPKFLIDYNDNLNTNITFNWLNFTSSVLANKIYNLKTDSDEFFLNDFKLEIFNNEVNYKTDLYQIINSGFKKIY